MSPLDSGRTGELKAPIRTLHITRDLPPRTRGGISTAVAALVGREPALAGVVSFDGWRPSSQGGGAKVEGMVCRLSGPGGLEEALAFAVALRPQRVVVHHAMLWAFARRVRDGTGANTVLFAHVAQNALRRLRGLTQPTASERAQEVALGEVDELWLPSEAARTLFGDFARTRIVPVPVTPRADVVSRREPGRVVMIGRYDVMKGTADALALLQPLLIRQSTTHLVLVGGLPDNPKSERRWIRRWKKTVPEPVAARLETTGWLPQEEVDHQLARAAVVLAPSYMETFALAVREAQQCGCAVVASDIGAHREHIEHGVTGLLVRAGDTPAWVEAVGGLLEDPVKAFALGVAAREGLD